MTCQLICKLCGELIQSELVIKDKAVQECADRLALHIDKTHGKTHEKELASMQKDLFKVFAGLCMYHTLTNFANYETDEIIVERMGGIQTDLMEFIGFEEDPEDDSEENTEDDSKGESEPEGEARFDHEPEVNPSIKTPTSLPT